MQNFLAQQDLSGFVYLDLKTGNVRWSGTLTFVFTSASHSPGECLGRRKRRKRKEEKEKGESRSHDFIKHLKISALPKVIE